MRAIYLGILFVLATSCSPGREIQLLNNTAEPLTLTGRTYTEKYEEHILAPRESRRIPDWYKEVRIQSRFGLWCYDLFPRPPRNFIATRALGSIYYVRAQIETNGTILVAAKEEELPVLPTKAQPVGYPVHPRGCA